LAAGGVFSLGTEVKGHAWEMSDTEIFANCGEIDPRGMRLPPRIHPEPSLVANPLACLDWAGR